jgi:hypothetical protein
MRILVLKVGLEEGVWGAISQGAMKAPTVIEGLKVIEERGGGGALRIEGNAVT